MLGTDFYVFLLDMVLAIVLLFMMVWHVSMAVWNQLVVAPLVYRCASFGNKLCRSYLTEIGQLLTFRVGVYTGHSQLLALHVA